MISEWVTRFNVRVRPWEERPDRPAEDVVYRVKDLFTTRDGSWEPSNREGALPQWARDRYLRPFGAPDYFDDAGADHHLFARVLDLDGRPLTDADLVQFWSGGFAKLGDPAYQGYRPATPKQRSGWANIPVFSHYSPERGEIGPWCWCPRGAGDVVEGGGMPFSWHVSTFAVWQAEPQATEPDGPETPGPAEPGDDTALDDLRRQAWNLAGLALDPDSPFVHYARSHNLGAPLTGVFDAAGLRAQGFAGGIVYAPAAQPHIIRHVAW
jgi:hypothetical protein